MSSKHAYPHDFGMEPSKGLTKHEWFMGMALMGLYANPKTDIENHGMIARIAIDAADALVEEYRA